jgi:hypothetical protein
VQPYALHEAAIGGAGSDAAAMLTGSIGMRRTGTEEMGDAVAKAIRHAG